jgi:NhaP-type Na+/H+ or K+/H+ antiporter
MDLRNFALKMVGEIIGALLLGVVFYYLLGKSPLIACILAVVVIILIGLPVWRLFFRKETV